MDAELLQRELAAACQANAAISREIAGECCQTAYLRGLEMAAEIAEQEARRFEGHNLPRSANGAWAVKEGIRAEIEKAKLC